MNFLGKFNKIMDYKTIFKDSSKLYAGLSICYIILCITMIIDTSTSEDDKKWKSVIFILIYILIFMLYGALSMVMNEV
jgi:hypothetical protein